MTSRKSLHKANLAREHWVKVSIRIRKLWKEKLSEERLDLSAVGLDKWNFADYLKVRFRQNIIDITV